VGEEAQTLAGVVGEESQTQAAAEEGVEFLVPLALEEAGGFQHLLVAAAAEEEEEEEGEAEHPCLIECKLTYIILM
jgi:hypothetical protein